MQMYLIGCNKITIDNDNYNYNAYVIPETKINKFITWLFGHKKLWK